MKRIMILLLAAVLLMTAGCGAKAPEATEPTIPATEVTIPATEAPTEPPTEEPTEPPTEPVPECEDALVLVDDTPAVLMLLNRGNTVDVVGEYDENHYVIKTDNGYGLVEKQLLRLEGEIPYEVWNGFAMGNAEFYTNYQLRGEAVRTLGVNTPLEVLDELKYCYVVKLDEEIGYILKSQVSKTRIQYSGGGNSGGADGGDISLSGGIFSLAMIEQSGDVTGSATVLADEAQVILGYFHRDEYAPVVAEEGFAPAWEGYYTVYVNGMYAYIPAELALAAGEEPAEQQDGFAGFSAVVYDNYLLQGEGKQIPVNTAVTVLWDGGDFCVVSINGEIGYMASPSIGQSRFSTGGGGGNSGGGDWTPPAM